MTPMTAAPAPRRGSFFETWRLFAGGSVRVWLLVLALFPGMAMPLWFVGHGKVMPFLSCAVLTVLCCAYATWQLEGEMGERLAFLGIVPQPVDPRRLVLMPICLLGLIATIALAFTARMSVGAALALLGTAWWAVAATRWLWKLRFWPLFALPILAAGPAAAHFVHRLAGWGAAAAVSMGLAIGALALQPRVYVGEPLSRRMEGGSRVSRRGPRAGVARAAISLTVRHDGWLAWAARFVRFTLGWHSGIIFTLTGALTVVIAAVFPILGYHADALMLPVLFSGAALATAYSGNMHEFLRTRPIRRGPRHVASWLPPLFIVLLAPATALCLLDYDWINHNGLVGLFRRSPGPAEDEIRYLRAVLGATFLPDKWPAGGLPRDLWARLQPLLYLDILRAALMSVSMMFVFPVPKVGESTNRRSVPPTNIVLLVLVFGTLSWSGAAAFGSRWPVPRLWFLVLLACVSVAHFIWRARVAGAPGGRLTNPRAPYPR